MVTESQPVTAGGAGAASAPVDRWLPPAALLVTLWLVALVRALTRVFVLNFSTAGPNATGLLALLLVTGWTVPVAARLVDRSWAWHATVALAVAGLLGSLAGDTLLALVAAVAALTSVTPVLVALVGRLRERFALAGALGVLCHATLRALLDTAPPAATTGGRVALVALAAGVLAAWWWAAREGLPTGDGGALAAPGGATTVAFLFAQVTFLGLVPRVALWTGRPYALTLAATVGGLLAGALLVARRGVPGRPLTLAAAVALPGSLAVLLYVSGPGIAALPAGAAAVVLLARGCRAGTTTVRRVGAAVVAVQVAALALTVGAVFAMNAAFVPGGSLVRGRAPVFLLAVGALLSVATLARGLGTDGTDRRLADATDPTDDRPVSGARRSLLAAAGAGLAALGGAGSFGTRRPDGTARADPLGAMSLNVHQYVDADGDHNLGTVRDLVAASDVGIVGLQETAGGRLTAGGLDGVRWLAHELGYHHAVGPPTRLASYGVALLSAWPVRDERVVVLPRRDSATRVALAATVESPLGDLPVVVAHLETGGAVRVAQAERVVELVRETGDPDRAVVLGDFNATPDEEVYDVLTATFDDPWAGSGADGFTYSASDPRRRIDYALVGRDWRVERGAVVGTPAVSDHLGVSVEIRGTGEE
jgi:endonuclease/exonuclease/phosphatase family metal-dependent hydrolase